MLVRVSTPFGLHALTSTSLRSSRGLRSASSCRNSPPLPLFISPSHGALFIVASEDGSRGHHSPSPLRRPEPVGCFSGRWNGSLSHDIRRTVCSRGFPNARRGARSRPVSRRHSQAISLLRLLSRKSGAPYWAPSWLTASFQSLNHEGRKITAISKNDMTLRSYSSQ